MGGVAKGINSKMKKFAYGHMWDGDLGSQGYHSGFASFRNPKDRQSNRFENQE